MARFLDANIPMYAGGESHPLQEPCLAVLRGAAVEPVGYVTSAEVLQEVIHRYLSQRRWIGPGQTVFWGFVSLMGDRVVGVNAEDMRFAAGLADRYGDVEGRDLVHVAVMQRLGVDEIISTDRGFDAIAEVTRIDPADWTPSQ